MSASSRDVAAICRRVIVAYVLPTSVAFLTLQSAVFAYRGMPISPAVAMLFAVGGLSLAARFYGRDGLGAAIFLNGSFVSLVATCLGLFGEDNGLASGMAFILCLHPLIVWVCAGTRAQRLVTVAMTLAAFVAIYAVGQPPTQGYFVPESVMTVALIRACFIVALSLAIAYAYDISVERSHRRLNDALAAQVEVNRAHRATLTKLEASETRYRYIFEHAFDGMTTFDVAAGRPLNINRSLATRLGYTPEALLRVHPSEVSPARQADGRPTGEAVVEVTAAISQAGAYRYPWRHVTAAGELVDFEVHTFSLPGAGDVRMSILRDVTEELRAKAGLQAANRELRSFAHAASHDLKEPLRTMSNFAQLLERRYAERLDESGGQYLGFITDAARRGTRLVEDLLRYAEAGTDEVDLAAVDLDAVGREVRQTVEARLAEEGARLEIGRLPTVAATDTWARQLLQNLVSNALKFKRPGVPPVVRVTSRQTARHFEVAVADNGSGLAADDLDRVFGIFERLVLREDYEGSGIGLALCRRIMDRVGGAIRVESELGAGTTFTLAFPKPGPDPVPATDGGGAGESARVPRVLA